MLSFEREIIQHFIDLLVHFGIDRRQILNNHTAGYSSSFSVSISGVGRDVPDEISLNRKSYSTFIVRLNKNKFSFVRRHHLVIYRWILEKSIEHVVTLQKLPRSLVTFGNGREAWKMIQNFNHTLINETTTG